MRTYYHCATGRIKRLTAALIAFTAILSSEIAAIAFFVLFFNLFGSPSEALVKQMLMTAGTAVLSGLALSFFIAAAGKTRIERCSRYTFMDIQLKAAVISRYSSAWTAGGRRLIYRELYYIPFRDFVSALPSKSGRKMVIRGKVRYFSMSSGNLGYHVKDGDIEFDRWWLNSGGWEEREETVLPALFGPPARICEALTKAKKRFDELPAPKEHVFREASFVRRRSKPRVMPENLDYSRNWK